MKIVLCCPTVTRPYDAFLEAVERSIPALDAAGIEHQMVFEVGSPYISWSRANMLQKAMKTDASAFVFLDHDLSWDPEDIVSLVQHPGAVVAGTYRYKNPDKVEYMGTWLVDPDNGDRPVVREDGTLHGFGIPAGFLKVSRGAVEIFAEAYPELKFGPDLDYIDLFNHGAYKGLWWGEDFAFARRWRALGRDIHLLPNLNVNHHTASAVFPGNLHEYLMRQPGGSKEGQP